jgi:chorismate-pyruvate lyase
MSSNSDSSLRRERFSDPAANTVAAAHSRRILQLLLAQDGSTTRLCETVAGGSVALHVLRQTATEEVPETVRDALPGTRFIERITSLAAHGEVMMDNLAYIALEGLEESLQRDLEAGRMPIGHLLSRLWVRRETWPRPEPLHQRLWSEVGLPDPPATRVYRIFTPEGPRMLIAETYRRGMLMERR